MKTLKFPQKCQIRNINKNTNKTIKRFGHKYNIINF